MSGNVTAVIMIEGIDDYVSKVLLRFAVIRVYSRSCIDCLVSQGQA